MSTSDHSEPLNYKVGAVVVTYYPNKDVLSQLVQSLSAQVVTLCLVDNTPGNHQDWHSLTFTTPRLQLIVLGENLGVAFAQNRGIERMMDDQCDVIAIFDQDSAIDLNYVNSILSEVSLAATTLSKPIAAAGPNYTNENGEAISPFVKVSFAHLSRIQRKSPVERYCLPACLISSGSILFSNAIQTIGLMREELFIDYVDTDWCLRAQQHGFVCLGLWNVPMAHTIGDKAVLALGKKLSFHAPLRHYYLVRNAIYLYFYSDLPVKWKLSDSIHLIAKFILYSIIDLPSTNHMMHMAHGFVDGITRKMGPRRGTK